jgi:hypothetical protein
MRLFSRKKIRVLVIINCRHSLDTIEKLIVAVAEMLQFNDTYIIIGNKHHQSAFLSDLALTKDCKGRGISSSSVY